MRNRHVIFAAPTGHPWHVANVTARECKLIAIEGIDGLNGPFKAIANALKKQGYHGEGIMLALPSCLCLCATVDSQGLRKGTRDKGLLFRLEEQLPLAMEEYVADFIPGDHREVGVAVALHAVAPLVEGIENEGIVINSISPTALLIADGICRHMEDQKKLQAILCLLHGKLDVLMMQDERVTGWHVIEPSLKNVQLHSRYANLDRSEPLCVTPIGLPEDLQSALSREPSIALNPFPDHNPLELAARRATEILNGNAHPFIELNRGALASNDPLRQIRSPLRVALAMMVLLSCSLAFSTFWRARRYDHLVDDAQNRQLVAFQEALPRQVPPLLITSRLLSEEKRLEGLSGTSGAQPPSLSALPLLQDVLRGLPPDVRFRLLELRFEPQRFYLEGQSLDHSSADRIAQCLRLSTGLQVDTPHTEEETGQDVTFEISAGVQNTPSEGGER
jgi:hypothetical protein